MFTILKGVFTMSKTTNADLLNALIAGQQSMQQTLQALTQVMQGQQATPQATPQATTQQATPIEQTTLFKRRIEKLGLRPGVDVILYMTSDRNGKVKPVTSLYCQITDSEAGKWRKPLEDLGFKASTDLTPRIIKFKRSLDGLELAYLQPDFDRKNIFVSNPK